MTMICENCNQTGIRWVGSFINLTHTECPHCGGTNCQQVDQPEDRCSECGSVDCNGECYGDDMMGASG
ncbi:MAG TPA: hypothetical protein K8W20_23385 [Pseudomonas lactis]|uniref:Uncharacterized protein n=1 Tax=Pseudomonas lactis TaxID=1615674 RepID=A0A921NKS6_9PSED|nr:hypothetical protein [Pseudomonas lactis]HJH21636.1 hypothetical protein [Pseudomonas lactis]